MVSTRPEGAVAAAARPKATRSGELHIVRDELAGLLAHDLKTPLAAISMNLDFALSELRSGAPDGLRAAIEDCRSANAHAIRIVSDMADAVRLASGDRKPSFGEVDAAELIASVVRRVAPEAASRGVQVVWTADQEVFRADADLLTRALERLLERALRQTRSGGTVAIGLQAGTVSVRVDAAAPGTAEPPTRALALHFAETAMRAQGGALWTEVDPDGALLYKLALPK